MAEKMEKVWNVSDHPNTKVPSQNLLLFGKVVMPGQYVKVPASRLKNAHKLEKDVENKLAHVGDKPPVDYLSAKDEPKAFIPESHGRARFVPKTGAAPSEAVVIEELAAETPVERTTEERPGRNGGRSRR